MMGFNMIDPDPGLRSLQFPLLDHNDEYEWIGIAPLDRSPFIVTKRRTFQFSRPFQPSPLVFPSPVPVARARQTPPPRPIPPSISSIVPQSGHPSISSIVPQSGHPSIGSIVPQSGHPSISSVVPQTGHQSIGSIVPQSAQPTKRSV
jgi:hypothetical protein